MDIKVDKTLNLSGLSFGPSWDLFKGLAFTREQENDPSWNSLGRKILKKCGNVPMAIKSVASLLYTKSSKEEWKTILDLLPEDSGGSIMPLLKLSYDSLPSNLKLCFSFCSMFPRYFKIQKDDLIRLWAAQGYVIPTNYETYEEVGEASFNKLERRFFLSDKKTGHFIEHGLIHDLAVNVAKGEIALTGNLYDITDQQVRHCTVDVTNQSSHIPPRLLACVRLRSFLFMRGRQLTAPVVEQLLTSFKFLRALDLRHQNIGEVPSSIGGLLHLRYLNLSGNYFQNLPESITELLNLLILDISSCGQLKRLPLSFARLINLRHLNNKDCNDLQYMPPRFGELTSLEHLSCFKVGNVTTDVKSSRLDALRGMQLRGDLKIDFDRRVDSWDEDECWELPTTVQTLVIYSYPGMRIPHWDQRRVPSLLPRLVKVNLSRSSTIKYLPPFRHLPYLKTLHFSSLRQLIYVEYDQDQHASRQCDQAAAGYFMLFFPFLEELELIDLPNLRGWSREVAVTTSKVLAAEEHSSCRDPSDQMPFFPILSTLKIERCPLLMTVPPCPSLRTLELLQIGEMLIHHLLSTCSFSLETAVIDDCFPLSRFSGQTLTSLRRLELKYCHKVKYLHLPQHNVLEELIIYSCPRLKLWGKGGVNWVSLINLRLLSLDKTPDAERLPVCLTQRTALGILKIDSLLSSESSVQGTKAQVDLPLVYKEAFVRKTKKGKGRDY
ncbi:hypothetical protein V2J09_010148 [Rumex salicifolius]